jgi:hypothetical protein
VDAESCELSERDERLGEIVFAYLRDGDQGQPLDRQALLARHPDFAIEFAEFFTDRDRLQTLAAPLREVAHRSLSDEDDGDHPPGDATDELPERC